MIISGDAINMDLSQFNRYGVIVADPPWPYDNPKDHNARLGGCPYSLMSIDDIQRMPVRQLAFDDCILYLWATWPKLDLCIETMKAWGFEYLTGLPWLKLDSGMWKPRYGIGHWHAACSEPLLIGRLGKVSPPDPPRHLALISPSFGHSKKPDSVHDLAERLGGPYLELFARQDRVGWDCFGNEVEAVLF